MKDIEHATAERVTPSAAWEHVKATANLKYPRDRHTGKANELLREAVKNLKFRFRHQPDVNVEDIVVDTKAATMRSWVTVGTDRQLNRILQQVEEIKVQRRENGVIFYRIDVMPLLAFDPMTAKQEQRRASLEVRTKNTVKVRNYRDQQRGAKKTVVEQIVAGFADQLNERDMTDTQNVQKFFRDLQEDNRLRALAFNYGAA